MREIYFSDEFVEYYEALPSKAKAKYDYVIDLVRSVQILHTKFVKKLTHTDSLYEMIVSLGSNEYRTILFTVDSQSFVNATKVVFLNSFLKKDTKQYKREIERAVSLLYENVYEED